MALSTEKFLLRWSCICLLLTGCSTSSEKKDGTSPVNSPFLIVLGTVQDGGSPHAGCTKTCCRNLYEHPDPDRKIISLGIVDPGSGKTWLFEASPDLPTQLFDLNAAADHETTKAPDGIFLSHAHIGHYTGLMYLGREAMNTSKTRVYAMPRFKDYLEKNGPWSQLVSLENIVIQTLADEGQVNLTSALRVKPFLVPHRDEYSETVGFIIEGPLRKALFIPDIDKWKKWQKSIEEVIRTVDVAFIDGTFYDGREINNRDISEIPHPFISESMELFQKMDDSEKRKVYFIHFNHTNPLLDNHSAEAKRVRKDGFNIASRGQRIEL